MGIRTPGEALKKYWGYPSFRPLQEEIITSILDGKDTLALLPTGGGKSICYQVPAVLQEGVTLVISPLIALMKDQVDQLKEKRISAIAIHSGLSYREIDIAFDNAIYGEIKLLYMSPERLRHPMTIERLKQMKVSAVAIDEAHCISQWGHDFRPSYRQISEIREIIPNVPFLALTATATPQVAKDIADQLLFDDYQFFKGSFARPNLQLVVYRLEDKYGKLMRILEGVPGTSIIYLRNRRQCKEIALYLQDKGINAAYYHAGLSMEERSRIQNFWIAGTIRVICATNAFGMGVDKNNVRSVIHLEIPASLEEYYQEAGRAGRDGERAFCVVLYNRADIDKLQRQFEQSYPEKGVVQQIYKSLCTHFDLAVGSGQGESFSIDVRGFSKTYDYDLYTCIHAFKILEQSGWISLSEAVYVPSRAMISVGKEALYDYQLKHKQMDILLKLMLRTYAGMFSDFVRINERHLANKLHTSAEKISMALEQLYADGIIDYIGASDEPTVTFLLPRPASFNFRIDEAFLNYRREVARNRLTSVGNYLDRSTCRMQFIQHYFGEHDAGVCGKCDICLGAGEDALHKEEYAHLRAEILKHLTMDAISVVDMVSYFPSNKEQKVKKAIRLMIEEGWLELEAGSIKLLKNRSAR